MRIKGSGRYAPGQTKASALADLRRELDGLETRFPGLRATLTPEHEVGRPIMPSFEVARDSRLVQAVNRTYQTVRGEAQPTGAVTPPGYYGTDAARLYRSAEARCRGPTRLTCASARCWPARMLGAAVLSV